MIELAVVLATSPSPLKIPAASETLARSVHAPCVMRASQSELNRLASTTLV